MNRFKRQFYIWFQLILHKKTKEEVQDTESKEQIEQRVKKYLAGNTVLQDEVAAKNLDLFTVDAKETTELKKNWNAIINIGKVDALLDSEMQQQVLIMKQELGFRYVRVWNIFKKTQYKPLFYILGQICIGQKQFLRQVIQTNLLLIICLYIILYLKHAGIIRRHIVLQTAVIRFDSKITSQNIQYLL